MQLVTLLGDVVASRHALDRTAVQSRLTDVLAEVNAEVRAEQPLEVTVGDEFQGAYATLAAAVRVSLLVRLLLLPDADTRYGLGRGGVTVFAANRAPVSQDGPGWWAAREAIEVVQARQGKRASARGSRTWYVDRSGDPWPVGDPALAATDAAALPALNAFLLTRDETVSQLGERARRLLLGWLRGATQAELAAQEGISQSAVSQSLARSGAYALRDAHDALDGRPA